MKLQVEANRARLTLDNEGLHVEEMWLTVDKMAGGSSIQTLEINLQRPDVEKIIGFFEAWLREQKRPT